MAEGYHGEGELPVPIVDQNRDPKLVEQERRQLARRFGWGANLRMMGLDWLVPDRD